MITPIRKHHTNRIFEQKQSQIEPNNQYKTV